MEKEIKIRLVQPEDLEGLVALYENVWPEVTYSKRDKANFVLNESEGINYCAEKDGEMVGSRTSFAINFYYGNRKLNCLHVGDSCTRSDCRGKGLFGKMNRALLADFFGKSGGELIYNISVPASRSVYEKLGWNYIQSLSSLLKFSRPLNILRKIGWHVGLLSGVVNWDLANDEITIEEDLLKIRERTFQEAQTLHVNYNQDTFNWRLKTRSGIKSFACEYGQLLYKIGDKNGLRYVLIGEAFLAEYNKKNLKKLIKAFEKKIQPDIIRCCVSNGHPLIKYYFSIGFFCLPKRRYLHHGVKVESDEMKEICYNPENWAISMLDVDTF